ncbi:phage portal protein [Paraburkholderia sp. IMGN_8]|uniref:phage portal protein n=1 Tax=Paraburkholderia sp. IMGN_8 TaxID=3136564 RepID=UPI003101AD5C
MFLSRIRADGATDRSPWGSFWFAPVGIRTSSGVRVTPASAMTLPDVLACVRVLAESFAIMPFELYKPKASGGRTKERTHWLYKLIEKAPNRFQTPYEWRMMLQGHLALRGNAFCQIIANRLGEITELLPLHPDRMKIELLDNGDYRYRYIDQNGNTITYSRHDIWHLRSLSDDGYMGLSLITLACQAIGEGLSMQDYSTRFFANDAKPGGGWIEYPGGFASREAKQQFRDSWQDLQGGSNRGKVAVLERGMKFHELGLTNKDSQFIEARGAKTTEIARIFRVPPHKIGDLSKATFSNIEQQSIEFWTDTMIPWARLWEYSLCFNLLGPDSDLEPDFDHKPMMRGDGAARATRITQLVQIGVMTRNEGREEEGYDPIAGLDEPLQPLNLAEDSARARR